MTCKKCGADIRDIAVFCDQCGVKQEIPKKKTKSRGNGQGTIIKLAPNKYMLTVTLGYYTDENGKKHRKTRSKVFTKKADAQNARLELLAAAPEKPRQKITFKQLYDAWYPTHEAKRGKSTMDCYKAAMKHFAPVWDLPMSDIDVDDLQDCIDTCGHGKRTQENMRAVCGLIYKYGIPRKCVPDNLNLAEFLSVNGEGAAERSSFTAEQIERIKQHVGKAEYVDYVYIMIYLGFRPSEFLALNVDSYNAAKGYFVGGAKTAAGKDRTVPISPKIKEHVERIVNMRDEGQIFSRADGEPWSLKEFTAKAFYPALEACGIDNPIVEVAGGKKRHKYTPHTCRHTFATLMKAVDAPDKDKLKLIGHTSVEMLQYYQDAPLEDIKKIIDLI